MPIRPDLKPLYRTPAWRAARQRVLARAGGRFDARGRYLGGARCEQCRKPDRERVYMYTQPGLEPAMAWADESWGIWRNQDGLAHGAGRWPALGLPRVVRVVVTVAHLNHVAGDDRDENLKALCQWCHLNYDRLHHRETRATRKDARRPLLQEGAS